MGYYECLESFIHVAETKGFSSAARERQCSVSLVSKHINWLEAQLNTTLFIRSTRKLEITSVGTELYQFSKKFMNDFEKLREGIQLFQHEVAGSITLTAPHRLGTDLICPHINHFMKQHPHINLRLLLNNTILDLEANDIDIAVRTVVVKNNNYLYKKLYLSQFRRSVYASPAYLEQFSSPTVPSDITAHRCLLHTQEFEWSFHNDVNIPVSGNYTANNINPIIDATVAGLGLAYIYEFQIQKEIATSALVEVLPDYARPAENIYLCYLNQNPIPKKISALIAFLESAIGSSK